MGVRADIVATAKATVGHIIRYITGGGAVNEMPNRQYLDFAGNCTVQDDGEGIKVTVPEVPAGSVTVGNVTTLQSGSMAYVTNSGTDIHAILNFGIPRGDPSTDIQPIVFGGTGADTAEGARQNLSVPSIADLQAVSNVADNSVHLTGNQTVAGVKTFSETITGNLTGDVTGNLTGNITGNAGTATKLETARSLTTKLDSSTAVTFDGSAAQDAIPVTGVLGVANGGTGSATQNFVDLTNDQTIAGTKTFSNSPVVPTATAGDNSTKAASTAYVDAAAGVVSASVTALDNSAVHKTGDETITGTKTFTSSPVIPSPAASDDSTKAATTEWINNACVHKTGDETIAGEKTFNETIKAVCTNVTLIKGTAPSSDQFRGIALQDSSNPSNRIAGVFAGYNTQKRAIVRLQAYKCNALTDSETVYVDISYHADGTRALNPSSTGTVLLGTSANKWKEIWCTQSSINSSSDERIKSEITSIPDELLDAWGEVNYAQFHFKDSVSEKGTDKARFHTGLIAQRVAEKLLVKGIDPEKYGFYLYDSWDAEDETIIDKEAVKEIRKVVDKEAVFDDEGNEISPEISHEEEVIVEPEVSHVEHKDAGDSYGLRYTEALCIEAAYQRRRADRLEGRIAAIEARLDV